MRHFFRYLKDVGYIWTAIIWSNKLYQTVDKGLEWYWAVLWVLVLYLVWGAIATVTVNDIMEHIKSGLKK